MRETRRTTARVQYEDYAHLGKFCDVNFYGFRAKEMQEKWSETKVKRCKHLNIIYEGNEQASRSMRKRAKDIYNLVAKSKPFYRWWYNSEEEKWIAEANRLIKEADQLKQRNKDIARKISFDNNEACREIEEFLQENGFVKEDVTFVGLDDLGDCTTNIKVWNLEE